MTPLLEIKGLSKRFPSRDGKGTVHAVSDVSLTLQTGETLGIVGESGCGKSTLARLILRLIEPSAGSINFEGRELVGLDAAALRKARRHLQVVFQDPQASLDPRMSVGDIIVEPLDIHGIGTKQERGLRVAELLDLVGLDPSASLRFPHEFSGGQKQRIGIARAIALEPRLIVLDEPVSALDVSIQSQILNLLQDLKQKLKLSYIFISHDLSVVHHVSDRVAVMYLGRIVEQGTASEVLNAPLHPYTEALVASVPGLDPDMRRQRKLLQGDPPNPEVIPAGCPFHPRCMRAVAVCHSERPALIAHGRREAACHLAG